MRGKIKMKRIIIILLMFSTILLLGCSTEEQKTKNETVTIEMDDTVKINYITRLEDEVIDTNIKEIAEKNNLSDGEYEPFRFYVSDTEKRVDKELLKDVLGKNNGSHSTVKIPYMFGQHNQSLVYVAPSQYYINKTETSSLDNVKKYTKNITLNESFKEKGWNSTITNINNETDEATITRNFEINQTFQINGLEQYVAKIDENKALIKVNVTDGERRILPLKKEGKQNIGYAYITINEEDKELILDFKKKKVGKNATIEYWIVDIIKN